MLKVAETTVVFSEIPGETTLALSLSGCPCRCPGCHSKYLWADVGEVLTEKLLDEMIARNRGEITCLCFLGGDGDTDGIRTLAGYLRKEYPALRVGWYSGRSVLPKGLDISLFDYIKLGPYLAHLGPLTATNTNQRLYRISGSRMEDITPLFWTK
ncbi:MAG: 4Fe-4S cluster-binding domain-containing protein [Bacteroidales bacterium]|nr:4Fe-4S cluster-binding domain-containing protein [Bacteroidales bacterium]